jgi:hypothetical protein
MLKSNIVERIEMREVMNDGEWVRWEDVRELLPEFRGKSFFDLADELKEAHTTIARLEKTIAENWGRNEEITEANNKNWELNSVISGLRGSVTRKLIRIDKMQAENTKQAETISDLYRRLQDISMRTMGR